DVPEVGQLVEPDPSQPFSRARDAVGVVARPLGYCLLRRAHRAELEEIERLPVSSDPLLDEEYRSARIELDQQRDEKEKRREKNQAENRADKTRDAGEPLVEA